MRQINEKDYVSFTISNGWNFTTSSWASALAQWNKMNGGVLYGNKPDGTRAILDSK